MMKKWWLNMWVGRYKSGNKIILELLTGCGSGGKVIRKVLEELNKLIDGSDAEYILIFKFINKTFNCKGENMY